MNEYLSDLNPLKPHLEADFTNNIWRKYQENSHM